MPERNQLALLAVLLLTAMAASAQTSEQPPPRAGDTVGWYIVRAGDTLIGITNHYLGSPSLWTENFRLNPQIRDPKHLMPGSRIRVIVSRQLPKRNALVDRVAQRVDAKPDPEPWTTAHQGDLLKENDGVRTYEKSSADLKFDDGSHLTMTENSLLFLKEMRAVQRGPTSETIEIIDGQADLSIHPQKKAKAQLNVVNVVIGSTSIKHSASGDRPVATRSRKASDARAQVMVYGGSSVVSSAGKNVDVAAGMGTQVEQGKPPEPPQKLLPAPAMAEPAAEATLHSGFGWKSVPGAATYTIEVFRDAGATQLVERATGLRETSWRPSALPYGDFYWRATAVSGTGLDGFPAKLVHFRSAARLTGTVAEDRGARGNIDAASPLAAVRLIAWRDDGNGIPDDDDVRAGETHTDAAGRFTFDGLAPAIYWITADSLTIAPSSGLNTRGLNVAATSESVWAEQTFGSAGARCAGESGEEITRAKAGPCVGGRWPAQSDDPRKLSTSKHIIRVDTTDPAISSTASFGFSFNVVDRDDDVEEMPAGRSSQGSLRQFIRNANAIAGPNAMRFLPASAPSNSRWTIRCATPLPAVTDRGTSLDGVAWMASDPARPRTLTSATTSAQQPDLEVDVAGPGDALTLAAETTISSIALRSEGTAIRATATLNANRLNVRSAAPSGVAAVVVDAPGSSIDQSEIDGGGRATAIVIESHGARVRISNTAVIHATNGIVIRAGSSDNSLLHVRFGDISGTAILFDPTAGARPARNRISEAEFVSVGTLAGSTGKPSSARAGACAYDDEAANRGIATPILFGSYERVPGGLGSLSGKACTGTTVEIYAESTGDRTTARFVKAVQPGYDGTFRVLDVIASAQMLVNLTDKEGNTSMFYASESPQAGNKK
jgi:hypothetical protein